MKKYHFIFLMLFGCKITNAQNYPALNFELLSKLDPETKLSGAYQSKYSGCWGWYQADKKREYAIVGSAANTYFIDITNPLVPKICAIVKAKKDNCTWREMSTYQNYCYIISDDPPPNSFQIVDMQYLPDSVKIIHDGTSYFEKAHMLYINNDMLYCASVTSSASPSSTLSGEYNPMNIYSLATPSAPLLIKKIKDDLPTISQVHDMYVRNDTVYASGAFQGLFIFKHDRIQNKCIPISLYSSYPFSGYNHSSALTPNGKTLIFTDEVPKALPIKSINVNDITNPSLNCLFETHKGATPHNIYITDNKWCFVSAYQDGLYLFNISNPLAIKTYGFFDTYPQHGVNDNYSTATYSGNWGAYPFLPSKLVVAVDMQNGIFILKPNFEADKVAAIKHFPNPAKDKIELLIINQEQTAASIQIYNTIGQLIKDINLNINSIYDQYQIPCYDMPNGLYFVKYSNSKLSQTNIISIQN